METSICLPNFKEGSSFIDKNKNGYQWVHTQSTDAMQKAVNERGSVLSKDFK